MYWNVVEPLEVRGLQVIGDVSSKGIMETWPYPLSLFLLPGHEMSGFALSYTPAMMCHLSISPNQLDQLNMDRKSQNHEPKNFVSL